MQTTQYHYTTGSLKFMNYKIIANIILSVLSLIAVAYCITFMAVATKQLGAMGIDNLIFSIVCIFMEITFIGLAAYDIYYILKTKKTVKEQGSYTVNLGRTSPVSDKNISRTSILSFVLAFIIFLAFIAVLVIYIIQGILVSKFVTVPLVFNCLLYTLLSCVSSTFSDYLSKNTHTFLTELKKKEEEEKAKAEQAVAEKAAKKETAAKTTKKPAPVKKAATKKAASTKAKTTKVKK